MRTKKRRRNKTNTPLGLCNGNLYPTYQIHIVLLKTTRGYLVISHCYYYYARNSSQQQLPHFQKSVDYMCVCVINKRNFLHFCCCKWPGQTITTGELNRKKTGHIRNVGQHVIVIHSST